MNLRHLGYLAALARERNFNRAARACHVTQPSLSAALHQLEAELGSPLVLRSRQRFEGFTQEGERALQWARQIIADVDSLTQSLGEARGQLTGQLRIGIIPTAEPLAGRICAAFHARHPAVKLTWLSKTAQEIALGIKDHSLEAGVSYADDMGVALPGAALVFMPLYAENYVVLGTRAWLGRRRSLTWQQVAALPLVLLNQEMQNRRLIDRHFTDAGVMPRVLAEASTLVGVLSQVREGLQCAIVPRVFADLISGTHGLAAIPLVAPVVAHTVGLITPGRKPQAPLVRALHLILSEVGLPVPLPRGRSVIGPSYHAAG